MTKRFLPIFLLLIAFTLQMAQAFAQPVIDPDASVMKLDQIGLYETGYAYRGQSEHLFPVGWSGFFEDRTGVACLPMGTQNGRSAFLLHCPWRNGTGIAFQQFKFKMPVAKSIELSGATAMRSDIIGKSDGATFRIFIDDNRLLDVNRTTDNWEPYHFDLTSYAGKTVLLRFETDPGPKDDPGFDYSLWGDRALTFQGFQPKPETHLSPLPLSLIRLASKEGAGVVPLSGYDGETMIRLENGIAYLSYHGPDGDLTYRWSQPLAAEDPLFGEIVLRSEMKRDHPYVTPLANGASIAWNQPVEALDSKWETRPDGIALIRNYQAGARNFQVKIFGKIIEKSLVLDVTCDQPFAEKLAGGEWGPVLRRNQVTVPYYDGSIFSLAHEGLFVNAFFDWTYSGASSLQGTEAYYNALTDGARNPLKERFIFSAAWHLDETLPNIPNAPSPYMKKIGNRVVLDIWGERYEDIAKYLERLSDGGVRGGTILLHVWQRSGYDNALPSHIPADPGLGGETGMKILTATAKRLGYLIALHENYVDYYPNYDHFDPNDISLDSEGNKLNAWYNSGTKIQSFAEKPTAILRLAATQSPEIHRRYGTDADYLDVHSAVPPWFHVDFRAGEAGAGAFHTVWETHRKLWSYERETHGGPVFGEGNQHWYWSGMLDGVEAQFGSGWPGMQGLTAPLMADFDLLKIHPLQFNHGMGYYERWWSSPTWSGAPPLSILDQYRMQEVAYGHAGFLGAIAWSKLPYAWLEFNLLTPVMERYSGLRLKSIRYQVDGKWVDTDAAAKSGDWRRVQTTYENGLTITANSSPWPLRDGNFILPQFGWLARGAGVTAYTSVRDGVMADYAETQESVFANARNAKDWKILDHHDIRPRVKSFQRIAPRRFKATYQWTAGESVKSQYRCFVHFCPAKNDSDAENILFQQDHALPKALSAAKTKAASDGPYEIALPDNLPDGDYKWLIGIYKPGGERLAIKGQNDGNNRISLGVIKVSDQGSVLQFAPERRSGDEQFALYGKDVNADGQVIDFETLRTNGSVKIWKEGSNWALQAYPRNRSFTLELNAKRFKAPAVIRCEGGSNSTVRPAMKDRWWSLPLNGAKIYRWKR